MKKNNELIKSENSIIKKVINFFKNIFWKNKVKEITEEVSKVETEIESVKENNIEVKENGQIESSSDRLLTKEELESRLKTEEELLEESDVEYEESDELYIKLAEEIPSSDSNEEFDVVEEKKRIIQLYNDIKDGKVSIESVDELDLMIINPLLQEEIRLKSEMIEKQILVKKNS